MITYVNEGKSNYLVYEWSEKNNDFVLEMLKNNKIDGLMEMDVKYMNGKTFLYYDISGKYSLKNIGIIKGIDKENFRKLLLSIKLMYDRIDAYFLEPAYVDLNPENIYTNLDMTEWYFAYACDKEDGIRLPQYLTEIIDPKDEDLVELAYDWMEDAQNDKFYPGKYIRDDYTKEKSIDTELTNVDAEEIEDCFEILNEKNSKDNKWLVQNTHILQYIKIVQTIVLVCSIVIAVIIGRKKYNMIIPMGMVVILETTLWLVISSLSKKSGKTEKEVHNHLENDEDYFDDWGNWDITEKENDKDDEKTQYMNLEEQIERKLYGVGKYRKYKFSLDSETQILGKDKSVAEKIIEDASVSRMHSRIYAKDNIMWLEDLNSLNGTYCNGVRLRPNEKIPLVRGDEIRLGCVEFIYR